MRAAVLLSASALATTLATPTPAVASDVALGNGAAKAPLHRFVDIACDGLHDLHDRTGPGSGFVTIRRTAKDRLIATVVLQDARPNLRYNLRIVQGDGDCHTFDGHLTTNARGRGTGTISEVVTSRRVSVFVSYPELGGEDDGDYYSAHALSIR